LITMPAVKFAPIARQVAAGLKTAAQGSVTTTSSAARQRLASGAGIAARTSRGGGMGVRSNVSLSEMMGAARRVGKQAAEHASTMAHDAAGQAAADLVEEATGFQASTAPSVGSTVAGLARTAMKHRIDSLSPAQARTPAPALGRTSDENSVD
jgi:hypothetical protein